MNSQDHYRAAGEIKPAMEIQTGGIGLNVKGIRIDVIAALPQLVFPDNERHEDLGVWAYQFKGVSEESHSLVSHEMCVTRRGYTGASPCSSQPGDLVTFLYGGPTPFTVRKTNGKYIRLGPTYLLGFMNREALQLEDAVSEDFVLEQSGVRACYIQLPQQWLPDLKSNCAQLEF